MVPPEVITCKSSSLGLINQLDRLMGSILKEVTSNQVWVLRNIQNKEHGKSKETLIYEIGLRHG